MKLKSKLIATIVSICAAIAVMGVGVWAASTSFTVTVTNSISLNFTNLAGAVTVSASTGAYDGTNSSSDTASISPAKTLYSNGVITYNKISTNTDVVYNASDANATGNLEFAGANFLTSGGVITANTTSAAVMYDFTYTASSGDEALTVFSVDETDTTVTDSAIAFVYYARVDSTGEWAVISAGTSYKVAAGLNVSVRAVALYTNANGKTTSIDGKWVFSVAFDAKTEAEASSITEVPRGTVKLYDTVTNGGVVDTTSD